MAERWSAEVEELLAREMYAFVAEDDGEPVGFGPRWPGFDVDEPEIREHCYKAARRWLTVFADAGVLVAQTERSSE